MKHLFNCRENELTGGYGWVMQGKPWMEPFELAVPHDCLEHFSDDTGRIEDELQALGASIWVRYGARHRNQRYSWAENVWIDITRQYHEYNPSCALLRPCVPRTSAIEYELDELIPLVYRKTEHESETLVGTEWDTPQQRRYLRAWLSRGYHRARRRYPNRYNVGSLYDSIYDQMLKIRVDKENRNDVLEVRYAKHGASATVRIIYEEDYDCIE